MMFEVQEKGESKDTTNTPQNQPTTQHPQTSPKSSQPLGEYDEDISQHIAVSTTQFHKKQTYLLGSSKRMKGMKRIILFSSVISIQK